MEARQRDELELVSHGRQFGLEARDAGVIQFLLPVKRLRAIADSNPPRMQKNPSAVRLPVRNSWSRGSISLVSRWALLASVRAIISVGTPITSAASRAATSF